MTEQNPRVEYRAQGTGTFTRVYRYEDGVQKPGALYFATRASGDATARELNTAVATGVRLASEHLDRDAVVDAIRKFDFGDYGMDDVSYALETDPDAQEWVGDLANAVIRALGGTCA